MSRPQDLHRPHSLFGNPFRMMRPKNSYVSPRLLTLLNNFEETLAERIRKIQPKGKEDVLSLAWMKLAMESLCETHTDIKAFITSLELPVCDWDDKWIHVYLDNSVRLLDMCIGFSSDLTRLNQGQLFLQCAIHSLTNGSSDQLLKARSSLDGWKQHVNLKNLKLENCYTVLENLTHSIDKPKFEKKSSKAKILMRAMYGVKVVTVFVCSAFLAAFLGSAKKLVDLQVPEKCLWAEAFTGVQAFVNGEIRNIFLSGDGKALKELHAVDVVVKKLYPMVNDGPVGPVEVEEFKNCVLSLRMSANKLSEGINIVTKEVDGFFKVVLGGRDALLCNLRLGTDVSVRVQVNNNVSAVVR